MKIFMLSGVAALAAVASFAVLSAQAPPSQQSVPPPAANAQDRGPYGGYEKLWTSIPIHTTLLPKDATVPQLAGIMIEWRAAIADEGHCVTCHSQSKDPKNVNQFGFPEIDAYDDSKPQYKAARQMYLMTVEMNKKYASTTMGKVTCGTCHRGHMIPQAYVPLPLPMGPPTGQPATPPKAPAPKP